MYDFLSTMPPWAPLVVAAIALAVALASILYARHAIALACDRLETAQDFERRLLRVLGQHPEILDSNQGPAIDSRIPNRQSSLVRDDSAHAREFLRGSADLGPTADDDWKQTALMLIAQSRYDEAETICRKEVEIDPKNVQAHNTLGVVFRKTHRLEAAVAACRQATMLEPACVSAHINLGVALRNIGRPQQAEAAYRRAIELEPDHAVAHSSLGVALNKQGRNEEAEACYLKALEIDSRYTPAWLNLAIALQKRGALEEAQSAYRCALELGTAAHEAVEEPITQAAVA